LLLRPPTPPYRSHSLLEILEAELRLIGVELFRATAELAVPAFSRMRLINLK